MYVVEELTPFKTWFIRVYMVHEFSCSLLSLSLAVLQITALVHSNTVMLKAIFIANLCQFVQELYIGSTAFYTAFYIRKLVVATQLSDFFFRQIIIIMNLLAHLCRMGMCAATAWIIAPIIWESKINLRIQRKIDRNRLTAMADLAQATAKENRWLLMIAAWVAVIAVGHFALNMTYVILDSLMEALVVAAGTSFLFCLLVFISIIIYLRRRYRLALIFGAYCTLNLFISASLLVASFIQDIIFGQKGPKPKYTLLYIADISLAIITVIVSTQVLKFCTRTLLETYTLAKQPICVTKAVRILRHVGLFSLLTVGLEFVLLLELRIEAMAAHLSMTSSIHDWLITAVQSLFLFWVTKYDRYQCTLLILIFQLANVSLVTLDLLAQQTDLIQMLITILFQHDEMASKLKTTIPAFPIDHFIIILILHFLQIAQWFLTVFALAISVYIIDNVVEDESVKSNDNHEISILGKNIGNEEPGPSTSTKMPLPPPPPPPSQTNGIHSFENSLFNDPLAMSRLPNSNNEMDTVDIPLDDPKKP
uniref:Gustatory receptor n=1 Tax=Panagrolaimus superbus TaxID=310955 RepID=A0A914ZBS1_9BILA